MELRKLYTDLEMYGEEEFKTVEVPNMEIICVSFFDNYTQKYTTFVKGSASLDNIYYSQALNDVVDLEINEFEDEESLLNEVVNFISKVNPDFLLGYNITKFDVPYLVNRCDRVGVDYTPLSPIKVVAPQKIKGLPFIDIYEGVVYIIKKKTRSKRLQDVAASVGIEVEQWSNAVAHYYTSGMIDNLIIYNLGHVDACVGLDEEFGITKIMREIFSTSYVRYEDVTYPSRVHDSLMLKAARDKGFVLKSNPKNKNKSKKYAGAAVLEPNPGLYENVVVFDLSKIYPSIILGYNICPTKHKILPEIIKWLFELREKYDKTDKEMAVKVLINSAYGAIGSQYFRYYSFENAEFITKKAKELLMYLNDEVSKLGNEVVFGDTDSLGIIIPENIEEESTEILKFLKDCCYRWANKEGIDSKYIGIDMEKMYEKFIIYGKKRYVGYVVWEEGSYLDKPKIDVKGEEFVRSDWPYYTSDMMWDLYNAVFKGEDPVGVLEEYVYGYRNQPLWRIGVTKGITKPLEEYAGSPIHVHGARYTNKHLNGRLQAGDKPFFLNIKSTGRYPNTHVVSLTRDIELPDDFEIDYEKMINRDIFGPAGRLFKVIGREREINNLWSGAVLNMKSLDAF